MFLPPFNIPISQHSNGAIQTTIITGTGGGVRCTSLRGLEAAGSLGRQRSKWGRHRRHVTFDEYSEYRLLCGDKTINRTSQMMGDGCNCKHGRRFVSSGNGGRGGHMETMFHTDIIIVHCNNEKYRERCAMLALDSHGRGGTGLMTMHRDRVRRTAFLCVLCAILLHNNLIVAASSSSSSGGGSGAPFMVMSEITVQSVAHEQGDGGSNTENGILSNDGDQGRQPGDGGERRDTCNKDGSDSSNDNINVDNAPRGESGSGSGSDTDGEEDEDELDEAANIGGTTPHLPSSDSTTVTEGALSSSASQPLRTLKRLQAMLDDSDYATHTIATPAVIKGTDTTGEDHVQNEAIDDPSKVVKASSSSSKGTSEKASATTSEKLWTSKDRAKYRRTRRTEKQRQEQQERDYEEARARKIRDIQRRRIIREERERKELTELRDRQMQQQAQQQKYDESTDFTEDDTDTDGGGKFELPDLPVYLSDAELTDDFSEEAEQQQKYSTPMRPQPLGSYIPQNERQQPHKPPPQYNYQEVQHQRPPPQQSNNGYHNYQQQYPPYPHQQYPQYNPNQPQMQQGDNPQRQYEQQYAAWAQAVANGYYYPPPQHPTSNSLSFEQQFQQAKQQHAHHQQYQYARQQQHNHGYQNQQPYYAQQQSDSFIPPPQSYHHHPEVSRQRSTNYRENGHQDHSNYATGGRNNDLPMDDELQQPPKRRESDTENAGSDTVDQITTPREEPPPAASVTSSSSTNSRMTVNSAFVPPAPPIVSRPSMSAPMSSGMAAVSTANAVGPYCELEDESAVLIAGTGSKISFDSIQKLSFAVMGVALLSYGAVSPRSLPFPEYNRLFLHNLSVVWLAAVAPIVSIWAVYDGRYNNINTAIGTFHVSFTLGYALAFISEVILTTAVRLGVFRIWEPAIFSLTPEVPSIILPWVLREKQYKPKRITLFAADFAASCVASPIIEEYLKLKVVEWTCKLPRNFKRSKKVSSKSKKRDRQKSLQPVRSIDDPQVSSINCYITQFFAASLGLKLFDTTRRILMYTKKGDSYKRVYALCRGSFLIHELCGTMTAIFLARRDVLGVNLPTWKILAPAVFIHAMANFRGMKPIFKWNSSTPWSEMQMSQLKSDGNNPIWKQVLPKTYSKLVWLSILCRALGFCMKNYYLVGRQAIKRTTTYSGKLHAFNAKLQTDAMLKRG